MVVKWEQRNTKKEDYRGPLSPLCSRPYIPPRNPHEMLRVVNYQMAKSGSGKQHMSIPPQSPPGLSRARLINCSSRTTALIAIHPITVRACLRAQGLRRLLFLQELIGHRNDENTTNYHETWNGLSSR